VAWAQQLLAEAAPSVEYVLWVDADALITADAPCPDAWLPRDAHAGFTLDGTRRLNTGVAVFRRGAAARELLERVWHEDTGCGDSEQVAFARAIKYAAVAPRCAPNTTGPPSAAAAPSARKRHGRRAAQRDTRRSGTRRMEDGPARWCHRRCHALSPDGCTIKSCWHHELRMAQMPARLNAFPPSPRSCVGFKQPHPDNGAPATDPVIKTPAILHFAGQFGGQVPTGTSRSCVARCAFDQAYEHAYRAATAMAAAHAKLPATRTSPQPRFVLITVTG
jgi:hypothetical protein